MVAPGQAARGPGRIHWPKPAAAAWTPFGQDRSLPRSESSFARRRSHGACESESVDSDKLCHMVTYTREWLVAARAAVAMITPTVPRLPTGCRLRRVKFTT